MTSALICGYGDLGRDIARQLHLKGITSYGIRRTPLSQPHATIIPKDIFSLSVSDLPAADYVFFTIRPENRSERAYKKCYIHALKHLITLLKEHYHVPRKIILCSSTEIYGNCFGKTVTEETSINPQTTYASILAESESLIKESPFNYLILRLPTLYTDFPYLKKLRTNHLSYSQRVHYTNFIH